ncbi:PTS sugar transporter subunit IIA [Aquamicrobium terrae]|uniref:PTS system galactitol-specific IIA component n=1 Tax=Aquamicrobium terrae TaxID=1324945 RepID=A0ABV2N837_9HYPH
MTRSLAGQIEREAIAVKADAATSEEVIRLLAGRLEKLGHVRTSFAEAVLAREARMPTGLPMGRGSNVAVPHTDPEHVLKPGIAIATLAHPVDFANMEDPDEAVPVGLVFMLALNDKDRQIEMLQQIMLTIQDEALSQKLLDAGTPDELLALLDGTQQGEQ